MMTLRTYENATPELLKNREQIRDRLRVALAAVTQECIDLRCVLGLDNPESLTYTFTEEGNTIFFQLCESDPTFCERYSSNPAQGEKELELAIALANFESEGDR